MAGYLVFVSFAALFCKVHSQLCSPPILPPPCPAPCVPVSCPPAVPPCPVTCSQVINPNPYVTTIIDNTVSNALVNALQLLIVSNLIGAAVPPAPLINNLGPLLDSIVCSNPYPVETIIPEYITYGTTYDIVPPYAAIPACGPYYDLIPPCGPITPCGPNYELIPPCSPIMCGPNYELVPPCGPIIDPYPPSLCGLPEIICPNFFTYTETITPICIDSLPYNGYGELIFPVPGESICPNICGGLTEIIPNYMNYPIPDICPSLNPFYGGLSETIALPSMFNCLNEVVGPCLPPLYESAYGPLAAVGPNYYGGMTEIPLPLAAEVMFPAPGPAPLSCNIGYSPSSLPCVRVNMEPLAYDNCVYNGYGGPIYY